MLLSEHFFLIIYYFQSIPADDIVLPKQWSVAAGSGESGGIDQIAAAAAAREEAIQSLARVKEIQRIAAGIELHHPPPPATKK